MVAKVTGTVSRAKRLAAARRALPAITTRSPSTRTGLVNPNSSIDAAICPTCSGEWVRALRA